MDECETGQHNCDASAACSNVAGSFSCKCNTGFQGDGVLCTAVSECDGQHNCDVHARCITAGSSFTCLCNAGWLGGGEPGLPCVDHNECGMGVDNCNRANATCSNTAGSFTCACNSGYTSTDGGVTCQDVDECGRAHDNNCNAARATCANTFGSFICTCDEGWTGDGIRCFGAAAMVQMTLQLPYTVDEFDSNVRNRFKQACAAAARISVDQVKVGPRVI
eukprot:2090432-Rhodomonas_salina.2